VKTEETKVTPVRWVDYISHNFYPEKGMGHLRGRRVLTLCPPPLPIPRNKRQSCQPTDDDGTKYQRYRAREEQMWEVPGEIDMPDDTDTGVYTGEYIF